MKSRFEVNGCTLIPIENYKSCNQAGLQCKDCPSFKLYYYKCKNLNCWKRSPMTNDTHGDIVNGRVIPCSGNYSVMKVSNVLNDNIISKMLNGNMTIKEIQDTAISLQKSLTTDVIKKARQQNKLSKEEHLEGFSLIEPYLKSLKELNPGTEYVVERESDGITFKSFAVILHYTKHILDFVMPIFGLDCGAMTPVRLGMNNNNETILLRKSVVCLLTGRLPGNQIVILGFAVGHTESNETIELLLRLFPLHNIDIDRNYFTLFSDRGRAIISSFNNIFKNMKQLYCPKHIEGNMKQRKLPVNMFWKAREAKTKEEFDVVMEEMKSKDPSTFEYFKDEKNWFIHEVIKTGNKIYDMKSDNIVECVMGWIKDIRLDSSYYFLKDMIDKIYVHINQQKETAINSNELLLPWFQEKFQDSIRHVHIANYIVTCTDKENMMFNVNKDKKNYRVDMNNNECTCYYWQQNGLPCFHATAVILRYELHKDDNFYTNVFDPEAFTTTLCHMFDSGNCLGKIPSEDEIRAKQETNALINGTIEATFEATTSLRIQSEGRSGGHTISATTLKKKNRIPCKYCGKCVKEGIHPARVCNKFKGVSLENNIFSNMNLDKEIVEQERSEDQMVQVPPPRPPPPPARQNVQVPPPPPPKRKQDDASQYLPTSTELFKKLSKITN